MRAGRTRGQRRRRAASVGLALAFGLVACAGGADPDANGSLSFGPGGNGDGMQGTDSLGTIGGASGGDGGTLGGSGQVDGTADGPGGGDNGAFCQDADMDGYGQGCNAGEDCDDDDPDVHPGAVETCDGTDENCNDEIDDGCECPDDGISSNCNIPTDLGPISDGDTVMGIVGNIPADNGIDWYVVSFPLAAARPGTGTPTIEFQINEDDQFTFDVVQDSCGVAGVPCTSGGTAGAGTALTSWSFVDDDPGCCTPPMDSLVAWPDPVFVRVQRTTMGPSCATYQLKVSR